MDVEERTCLTEDGPLRRLTDDVILLSGAELLLAAAEATGAKAGGDEREQALCQAITRMVRAAAALRSGASSTAAAILEEARRDRAHIAAELRLSQTEADVLRAEIELLRRERDLCLALAGGAGAAVSRELAQYIQAIGGNGYYLSPPDEATASQSVPSPPPSGAPYPDLPAAARADEKLAGALIEAGARVPAATIVLTISGLPGIVPVLELEPAMAGLPGVETCSVSSLRSGVATVDLCLSHPNAPLGVAALLAAAAGSLTVEAVGDGRVIARYAPTR